MEEHMRIELLDPKWKEQKEAADAKKKESNLLREGSYYEILYSYNVCISDNVILFYIV